ncbi:MAG TPA: histidinol-phosphate transaminase [Blastocatellia bacterium]|nr:histidinol-phosphate transaminase [Blastocatellia bacterium]
MRDPINTIKPAVRGIKAYSLHPYRASIKINQNENPYDMPQEIKDEVARRLATRTWSRYPDFVPSELLDQLAAFAGWIPDGTLAGNGSNELIQAVLAVLVGPGVKVVISEPTFTLYRQIVTIFGGQVISVPLTSRLEFDISALIDATRDLTGGVLILCSPNNPTGCRIEDADLIELARGFDGIVIVDEAYHEFSRHSVVPLLKELPNLIVLRTFSKAMAMAGLRVGYMLASPRLAREVHKATLPYNLNFVSSTVARVACERYDAILKPLVVRLIDDRDLLLTRILQIPGLDPVPSHANFFLVKTVLEPQTLFEELLDRDILVRDVSHYPMLGRYLRLSVGRPEENEAVLSALQDIMKNGPRPDDG